MPVPLSLPVSHRRLSWAITNASSEDLRQRNVLWIHVRQESKRQGSKLVFLPHWCQCC